MQSKVRKGNTTALPPSWSASAAFSSRGVMEGVSASLLQGWEGRLGNHVFYPCTLLKPSPICCKTSLPKASLPEQCQITGVLLIIPQLRGFTLEFCFKHSANPTNHLLWRESTWGFFDSAMIAQPFMIFVFKVDARFSSTKECLSEYYSKTNWVSIGLLIALNRIWTKNCRSQSRTAAIEEYCSWWYVVQVDVQAISVEMCLVYSY